MLRRFDDAQVGEAMLRGTHRAVPLSGQGSEYTKVLDALRPVARPVAKVP